MPSIQRSNASGVPQKMPDYRGRSSFRWTAGGASNPPAAADVTRVEFPGSSVCTARITGCAAILVGGYSGGSNVRHAGDDLSTVILGSAR